jgi:iron(III) transport system ATP-binding protein
MRKGRNVEALLDMVGLAGFHARFPHQLSGGQQQRVALVRALAIQPSLVLLDEPFSSLDADLRHSLRADVQRVLRDMHATALLVTHDQDEALSFADHVAVLREGEIAQHDTPQAIYAHPATPELARALGEVNLIPGIAANGTATTVLGDVKLEPQSSKLHGAVTVLVRPEQIAFSTAGEAAPSGKIVDSVFYGHDLVVRVALAASGTTVLVRRPGTEQEPDIGSTIGLRVIGEVASWVVDALD